MIGGKDIMPKTLRLLFVGVLIAGTILSALVVPAMASNRDTVRFVTVEFGPFYGPQYKGGGVYAEITTEAFKREGITVEIDFVPWRRALQLARAGKYDGVLGAYHSEKRAKDFLFSDPVLPVEIGFIALKTFPLENYSNLKELGGYRVGSIFDYIDIHVGSGGSASAEVTAEDLSRTINAEVSGGRTTSQGTTVEHHGDALLTFGFKSAELVFDGSWKLDLPEKPGRKFFGAGEDSATLDPIKPGHRHVVHVSG